MDGASLLGGLAAECLTQAQAVYAINIGSSSPGQVLLSALHLAQFEHVSMLAYMVACAIVP